MHEKIKQLGILFSSKIKPHSDDLFPLYSELGRPQLKKIQKWRSVFGEVSVVVENRVSFGIASALGGFPGVFLCLFLIFRIWRGYEMRHKYLCLS